MANILVVDDDPEIRAMVVQKLAAAGHTVRAEADGDAAMSAVEADTPDVVLVDWMLPGRSGIQVCEAVRERTDALVFILTARAQADDVRRGYEAGADGYIIKPFSPRELLRSIDDALAARSADRTAGDRTAGD
ncbi:response regulator [Acidiferrimicrobium sp. IK]|uniref:response regulator transcription factor n=1 Tax=Acidiferrimicrobium sp. IK TaxID=2871700 RepID=UPI0021CB72CF|nr:response regulator [Acidiferrimicrobium sp. IK]MCU4184542.1 response regulator [Acidiferrimicrobium sp. IK]